MGLEHGLELGHGAWSMDSGACRLGLGLGHGSMGWSMDLEPGHGPCMDSGERGEHGHAWEIEAGAWVPRTGKHRRAI